MAIEQDLNISINGFNTEQIANTIGHFILDAIRTLDNRFSMELNKLKFVVVSYDFASALQKVSSDYLHNSPSSFTKSTQGEAIGQLVAKMNSDGSHEEFTLVLSTSFFVELFNTDGEIEPTTEGVNAVLHRIHHELAHVHEFNTLTKLDRGYLVNDYGDAVLIAAMKSWSEYLANFLSATTATQDSVDMFLEHFNNVINEVPDEIYVYKNKYRLGMLSLDEMFHEVRKRVKLIVDACGYAMGYVHALEINIDSYYPEISSALAKQNLDNLFHNLTGAFSELREKYTSSEFNSLEDYKNITNCIEELYKKFGLTLECDSWGGNSGLYIHVK